MSALLISALSSNDVIGDCHGFAWRLQTTKLPFMPSASSPRGASKKAVSRSPRRQAEAVGIDHDSLRLKYQLLLRAVDGARVAIWILASWLPLTAVGKIAENIAGKETRFTATVSISIAISILLSVGWGVTAVRSHGRKREIDRLRGRNDNLERSMLTQRQSPEDAPGGQVDSVGEGRQ